MATVGLKRLDWFFLKFMRARMMMLMMTVASGDCAVSCGWAWEYVCIYTFVCVCGRIVGDGGCARARLT